MNAIGLATLSLVLVLVLFAPSRWALTGVLCGVLYMTLGQTIEVAGLHIFPTRMLTLAAFVRVIARGEWSVSMLNGIDKVLLLTYGYQAAVFILNGNGSPLNMIGGIGDVGLAYFVCRCLLRSFDDLEWFLRVLAILLLPYVALLYVESSTGSNPFTIIGGASEHDFRNGRPRCMGSFSHPGILGTFGASFLPLFIALSLRGTSRVLGILGLSLCLAIVFFSNSGGPVTCVIVAVIGWLFWRLRTKMSIVRALIFWALVVLGFIMKAPLWYLPAKMSAITGGDGWHRSYLMDVAFRNLDQWWLAGMSVLETKDWFPYVVATGGADIINYYLGFGIAAGVAAIGLFCFLLVRALSRLGRALEVIRLQGTAYSKEEMLLWALGVVLAIHMFNWFGMVYFDQYFLVFFMQLAALSTLSHVCINDSSIQTAREESFSLAPREKCYHRYKSAGEGGINGIVRSTWIHQSWKAKYKYQKQLV
ncbi:MAG: O-antigen ligase family protein [Methylobacter sp.]